MLLQLASVFWHQTLTFDLSTFKLDEPAVKYVIVMREIDHEHKPGSLRHVICTMTAMFYLPEDHCEA